MFVILSYDISSKHGAKALKLCRKYLHHVHKSVFDGRLTPAELNNLEAGLADIIDTEMDTVRIYKFETVKYAAKDELGLVEESPRII
mgnify:CR=1 FL=1